MTTSVPPQPANWSREFVVLTPRDTATGTFSGIGHVHALDHIPAGRYHLVVTLDGVPTARIAVDMAEAQPPDTITVNVTMTLTVVPAVDPTDPLP